MLTRNPTIPEAFKYWLGPEGKDKNVLCTSLPHWEGKYKSMRSCVNGKILLILQS